MQSACLSISKFIFTVVSFERKGEQKDCKSVSQLLVSCLNCLLSISVTTLQPNDRNIKRRRSRERTNPFTGSLSNTGDSILVQMNCQWYHHFVSVLGIVQV